MAPDRGQVSGGSSPTHQSINHSTEDTSRVSVDDPADMQHVVETREDEREFLARQASSDTNFTVRGIVAGSVIGIIICFSNTYFGLQTGWVSGMAMPAALIGFAFFKSISRCINYPFTPVENVLVQTVAGAVGTMPLGAGFVGVIPALNYLLKPDENGPFDISLGKLIVWSVGICFFGVFVAVPLRKEVIIREKLRFPSGTATALMIRVLHDQEDDRKPIVLSRSRSSEDRRLLNNDDTDADYGSDSTSNQEERLHRERDQRGGWKARIRLLTIAFGVSFVYTLVSYFIPQLHNLPIFGTHLASHWVWTLNPSPAYVGQGIIMGPATSFHMLFGAILGWAILSPVAKKNGWAAGPVGDWTTGSKGWIVWVSLAIMLADSVVSLGWLALRPTLMYGPRYIKTLPQAIKERDVRILLHPAELSYTALSGGTGSSTKAASDPADDLDEPDAPPEHLASNRIVYPGFFLSLFICVAAVHITFPSMIPLWATILAVLLSLILSLMGVRALGETDLNPVSGISKLTQLIFAALLPNSPNAIIINLLAGAISESAALQAGDMMQDLKAGHIIGASPKAQFYGQLIGSLVGSVSSALVYKLYTNVYPVPSKLFQIPTGYVWVFTARLVTGQGLPEMASQYSLIFGSVWVLLTVLRIFGRERWWQAYVPGGVAVAVGMYNEPSFTLARAVGGAVSAYWLKWKGGEEAKVVILASGLILGEGVGSIVNLAMASGKVPHL
jgi:OPT family oligopeptide transporter